MHNLKDDITKRFLECKYINIFFQFSIKSKINSYWLISLWASYATVVSGTDTVKLADPENPLFVINISVISYTCRVIANFVLKYDHLVTLQQVSHWCTLEPHCSIAAFLDPENVPVRCKHHASIINSARVIAVRSLSRP